MVSSTVVLAWSLAASGDTAHKLLATLTIYKSSAPAINHACAGKVASTNVSFSRSKINGLMCTMDGDTEEEVPE